MKVTINLLVIVLMIAILCSCNNNNNKIDLVQMITDVDALSGASSSPDPGVVLPAHLSKRKKYEPFMVDKGIRNLALYKPAEFESKPLAGEMEQLTDDIKTSEPFQFISGPNWVQVDLEEPVSIHAIVVWHYFKGAPIYDDVIVMVSNNRDFSDEVVTLFNDDRDNSSGHGIGQDSAYVSSVVGNIVDARGPAGLGTTARFVRVYTRQNSDGSVPRYLELAVYGFRNEDG